MIKKGLIGILVCTLFCGYLPYHAIYLSVIEMTIDAGHVKEMRLKVFSDDLADAVRAQSGDIIPTNRAYTSEEIAQIQIYFEKHLQLISNADTMFFNIKNVTLEGDASWFDLILLGPLASDVKIKADYLMEIFPTQSNMLRLSINKKKSFHQLKRSDGPLSLNMKP